MKELEKILPYLEQINPYLLSGGAGALATGIAASQIKRDPKKSRLADIGRKLAIALGGGLAAAGVHKAINTAGESFSTALPETDVSTEEKIVNTATNPNTTRLLAALGIGGATFGYQTKADRKNLRNIRPAQGGYPGLGSNPVRTLKAELASNDISRPGVNNLKALIESQTNEATDLVPKELKTKVDNLQNDLKNALKIKNPNQDQKKMIDALKQNIADAEISFNSQLEANKAARKANLATQYADAGFNVAHYEPGKLNKIKRTINPYASRMYGRSLPGKAGKLSLLASALFAPQLIDAAGEAISSKPVE